MVNNKLNVIILLLNNFFPREKGVLWITPTELCDRLVHCDVHCEIAIKIVESALQQNNRVECIMKKNKFDNRAYCVPQLFFLRTG